MLTYLLLDLENVKPTPEQVAAVRGESVRLWIFRGPKQGKFEATLAEAWQPLGTQVRHIKSTLDGKNALDFLLAYELGRLREHHAHAGTSARYVVVSGDAGFDSLMVHAATDATACSSPVVRRVATLPEAMSTVMKQVTPPPPPPKAPAPPLPPSTPQTPAKKVAIKALRKCMVDGDLDAVAAGLRASPKNRPADRKALEHHIVSLLRNQITAQVSHAIANNLIERGWIKINGKKVEYKLPKVKHAAK